MKLTHTLTVVLVSSILFTSCQKKISDVNRKYSEIAAQTALTAQNQKPVSFFDNENKKGLFHGLIASSNTIDRGKIWINLGNNNNYDAYVEMVNGIVMKFVGTSKKNSSLYEFKSENGYFTADLSGEEPVFSDIIERGDTYFLKVYKQSTKNTVKVVTGRFHSEENEALIGTWSLLSDGKVADPNGNGGEAITSVVVTMGGEMMVDDRLELINDTCIPLQNVIPQLSDNSDAGLIGAYNQISDFNGETKWNLSFCLGQYLNTHCKRVESGNFEWTSEEGTTHEGTIFIDDPRV